MTAKLKMKSISENEKKMPIFSLEPAKDLLNKIILGRGYLVYGILCGKSPKTLFVRSNIYLPSPKCF